MTTTRCSLFFVDRRTAAFLEEDSYDRTSNNKRRHRRRRWFGARLFERIRRFFRVSRTARRSANYPPDHVSFSEDESSSSSFSDCSSDFDDWQEQDDDDNVNYASHHAVSTLKKNAVLRLESQTCPQWVVTVLDENDDDELLFLVQKYWNASTKRASCALPGYSLLKGRDLWRHLKIGTPAQSRWRTSTQLYYWVRFASRDQHEPPVRMTRKQLAGLIQVMLAEDDCE